MTEGQISIIIAIIGMGITVFLNVIKFANVISKIESSVNHLNEILKEFKEDFKESKEELAEKRKRLWEHNNKQDKILDEHEVRITNLERSKEDRKC